MKIISILDLSNTCIDIFNLETYRINEVRECTQIFSITDSSSIMVWRDFTQLTAMRKRLSLHIETFFRSKSVSSSWWVVSRYYKLIASSTFVLLRSIVTWLAIFMLWSLICDLFMLLLMNRYDENSICPIILLHHTLIAWRSKMLVRWTRRWWYRLNFCWFSRILMTTRVLSAGHHNEESQEGDKGGDIPDYCQRIHAKTVLSAHWRHWRLVHGFWYFNQRRAVSTRNTDNLFWLLWNL